MRSGFPWGAPTRTASGFDWSDKFFELYEARGADRYSEGVIFRADDFKQIKEVVVSTTMKAALLGVIQQEFLTNYAWGRVCPTVALRLKFTPIERASLSLTGRTPQSLPRQRVT